MAMPRNFFIGLISLISAFLCVLIVTYGMVNRYQLERDKVKELNEQIVALDAGKTAAQRQIEQLERRLKSSVTLDALVEKARDLYGPNEANRQEGYLWWDKEENAFIVTLGLLNGIQPQDRLSVYEGKRKLGTVRVETTLDVVSLVKLSDLSEEDLRYETYRVVKE